MGRDLFSHDFAKYAVVHVFYISSINENIIACYDASMPKKYRVKEKVSNDIVEQLLHNRGVKGKKEREKFLNPDFANHLHDPFLLPDMEKAVKRILKAIAKNEKVGIWSDYDADGIPGGALLHDFFKLIGFNNFINYIPDRHTEGYGLNIEGIERLTQSSHKATTGKEEKVSLLITVDCGIRDNEKIEILNKMGVDVIVTDHHEPGDKLPDAFAVIDHKRKDSKYPESILCGAGVVWKLIQGILKIERLKPACASRDLKIEGKKIEIKEGQEKWLLDLVGLATLSDMVPLIGENRVLAHYGLRVLRKSRRLGLNKLLAHLRMDKSNLTEDDVAFMITPRINAASRMGAPIDAFKLLTAADEAEAEACVRHLDNINNERKGMVASIVKEAKKKVREKFESLGERPVIVLGNPEWRPALLGLAAGSIAEEYNRPVFLWGREGGEFIKGSCRSEGSTDLVSLMERARESFLEFGGHKMSGGFSVDHEKVHTLEDALIEASLHSVNGDVEIAADAEISLKDVSGDFVDEVSRLAPFGVGNEKPLFVFREVVPERINRFGKNKEHLSIDLKDGTNALRAISFFASPDQFGDLLKEGIKTNLVANVEKSFWGGRTEIRLRIVDFF